MDLLEPSVIVEPPRMTEMFRMEFQHTMKNYQSFGTQFPKFNIQMQQNNRPEEKMNYFLPQKPVLVTKPDNKEEKYKPTYASGHWSIQEHQAFLRGVKELGLGKWSEISKRFVKTRLDISCI
eukprot:gene12572-6392_t